MKKCANCGTEFEGNFCPQCGEKFQIKKKCPNCGEENDGIVKFCSFCGYSFKSAVESNVMQTDKHTANAKLTEKFYDLANYIPIILFALFSVLLFTFFAAPVYGTALDDLFGGISTYTSSFVEIEEEVTQSTSVYSLLSDETFGGAMSALIVFGVFAIIAATCTVASVLFRNLRYKTVKNFRLSSLIAWSAYVFYFIFFLIGCIIAGKINAFDEGAGILKVGACPILLIVFSIIFSILSAGVSVCKLIISKKYPDLLKEEEENFIIEVEHWRKYKENLRGKKAEYESRVNSIKQPKKPQLNTIEPTKELRKKLSRTVKLKRVVSCLNFPYYVLICYFIFCLCNANIPNEAIFSFFGLSLSTDITISITVIAIPLVLVLIIVACLLKVKWKPFKVYNYFGTIINIIILVYIIAICVNGINICVSKISISNSEYWIKECEIAIAEALGYIVYCLSACIISIIGIIRSRKLKILIFGSKHPMKEKEYLERKKKFKKELEEYRIFKKEEYEKYVNECKNLKIAIRENKI